MRIASGIVEKKIEGGKGILQTTVQQLKKDFSGYIFMSGENRGYLFIVSGTIGGAVFEGKRDLFGKQSLEKIMWESEQRNSSIEVHNYPQVAIILGYLPESKVEKEDLSFLFTQVKEEPTEDIQHIRRMFAFPQDHERIPSARKPLKTYLDAEMKEKHEKITEKLKEGYTSIPLKTKVELTQDKEARIFAERLKTLLAEDIKEEEKRETRPVAEKELREVLGDKLILKTEDDEAEKKKKEKVLAKVLKGAPVTLKQREFEEEPVFVQPEEAPMGPIETLKEEDKHLNESEKLLTRLNVPLSIIKRKK